MLIDARSLSNGDGIDADLCIVGGGTAGLILAHSLIGKGINVALLESGGLKPDKESHGLNWGENIGLPYYDLDLARARFFGGCCNRWHVPLGNKQLGARIRPLDKIDFEYRDWVPFSGWPFDKSHLTTYYDRAQEICRTTPVSYDIDTWGRSNGFNIMPLDPNLVETIIFKFCSKEPFVNDYANVVKDAGEIKTFLYANIIGINLDDTAGKVSSLTAACIGGNKFRVRSKLYVLATGGIEIPRLLLSSTQKMTCGIANQNDLVGRFFMEHLHFWSGLFSPFKRAQAEKMELYNRINIIDGVPVIAKLAPSEDTMRRESLINHNVQLIPRIVPRSSIYSFFYPRQSSEAVDSLWSVLSDARHGRIPSSASMKTAATGLDSIARAAMRAGFRKIGTTFDKRHVLVYFLANMTEQLPNPDCRVTLGTQRDQFDMPQVRLNWQVTHQDLSNAVRVQEIVGRGIEQAGLGRLYVRLNADSIPNNLHGGYHHMGTTRMHRDPKRGVVDQNSCVHGMPNLFIAGPSVFPTGGHANPVLTIIALTLRLSDHLTQMLRS